MSMKGYRRVLKNRLKKEGNETVTNCNQLKINIPFLLAAVRGIEPLFGE